MGEGRAIDFGRCGLCRGGRRCRTLHRHQVLPVVLCVASRWFVEGCRLPRPLTRRGGQQPGDGSELQRSIVNDFLHHKECSRLPHTGQRNELIAVNAVEIGHVTDPYFEEVIEITRDEVAVEDELQFRHGFFERGKAFRRGAIEHDADHHQRATIDLVRRDDRADLLDITVLEQRLGPPMACRGADIDQLRQLRIAQPPIALQQAEHFQIDPVGIRGHGRIFHIYVILLN